MAPTWSRVWAPGLNACGAGHIAGIPTAITACFYVRAAPSGWNASYSVASLTLLQNIR